jgi:uncharacterized membrane protein (DUF485 family)
MATELVSRVTGDPVYRELNHKRSRLAWTLTAIMLVIYYGFILLIAFSPTTLAQKLGTGAMTLGFPLGLAVIVSAIALTGIYVWKANTEYDGMTEQLRRHAQ